MSKATFSLTLPPATPEALATLREAFFEQLFKAVAEAVGSPVALPQRWTVISTCSDPRQGWATLELRFDNHARLTVIIEQHGTRCRVTFLVPGLCHYMLFRKATVNEPALMQDFERTWLRWVEDNPAHCYDYDAPMLLHSAQHQETLQLYVVDALTRLADLAHLCVDADISEGSSVDGTSPIIHVTALPLMD